MKERVVFFTIVSDNFYYPCGTPKFINSFKRFHPDIDLVVFRQDMVDQVFKETGINFFTAKPVFAKLLTPNYDLVVNIDADSIVLGRLDEILEKDYDIGGVMNMNDYENRQIENISVKQYLNAGLVASRNKQFWDIWEHENRNAFKYLCAENDILNLVWYNNPIVNKMKRKVFDEKKGYYGCKSLNREKECYLEDGKVMLRKEQVKVYHNAKGPRFPKLDFRKLGFTEEVSNHMDVLSNYGKTVIYGKI